VEERDHVEGFALFFIPTASGLLVSLSLSLSVFFFFFFSRGSSRECTHEAEHDDG
jgi:hypothetical protein